MLRSTYPLSQTIEVLGAIQTYGKLQTVIRNSRGPTTYASNVEKNILQLTHVLLLVICTVQYPICTVEKLPFQHYITSCIHVSSSITTEEKGNR
jgi:hypothetical protein